MAADLKSLATRLLNTQFEELTERELKVLERLTSRRRIARNINRQMDDESDFGDRLADRVASFGGSWKFIILFGVVLMSWVSANLLLTDLGRLAFDPYPFIFLNLILSMLAAIQAPITTYVHGLHGPSRRKRGNNAKFNCMRGGLKTPFSSLNFTASRKCPPLFSFPFSSAISSLFLLSTLTLSLS